MIILEDDIIFCKDFKQKLQDILKVCDEVDWDVIMLSWNEHNICKNTSVSPYTDKMDDNFFGMQAYLINKKGADKFIDLVCNDIYDKPIDVLFTELNTNGKIKVYKSKTKLIKLNVDKQYSDTQGII